VIVLKPPPLKKARDSEASSGEVEAIDPGAAEAEGAATTAGASASDDAPGVGPAGGEAFFPPEVETLAQMGLPDALIESLIFKHLLAVGSNTGRGIARDLCLPGKPAHQMLADLKARQFVVYKGAASMGDFEYALTDAGRERARGFIAESSYAGCAPVPLHDYVASVRAQTITLEQPGLDALRRAFSDLLIRESMLDILGPAINSGRGMFLYGHAGNGKTSIAERITMCFGTHIWVPRAIYVEGQIIQFFDPQCHERVGTDAPSIVKGAAHDARWVRIRRPTIVVGGELMMESLELCYNQHTKITEPSLQMKSNCGTLVIDDFGRQRMKPIELLNRWIVPLEKRHDFLTLSNGKKIQVPFDQLIIFSTNLEPRELVDDAFLRRIPYKINVGDPSEAEFRELLHVMAGALEVERDDAAVDYLIEEHYRRKDRPFRCCHPRDLLLQIKNRAKFVKQPARMSPEGFDAACENYFAVL